MNPGVILVAFLLALILVAIIFRIWGAGYVASQPVFSWDVRVVEKRKQGISGHDAETDYYITFEFADGSKKEYKVEAEEYRVLQNGDAGKLYTQANLFKGFEQQ
jgi:Protein of unknown function (DUF2500)